MKVWQTDVQIHFYFTSTVFVWIIHVELVNSGGQKTRVGSGTLLLSTGKQTNIKPTCIGKEKRRLWSKEAWLRDSCDSDQTEQEQPSKLRGAHRHFILLLAWQSQEVLNSSLAPAEDRTPVPIHVSCPLP